MLIRKGTICITTRGRILYLSNTYLVLDIRVNLILTRQLKEKGYKIGFRTGNIIRNRISFTVKGYTFTSTQKNRVYLLDLRKLREL